MKVLSIISQKGGVGKTTLATALAVAAERDGKSTAIFDLDPQASASFWNDTREADTPAVIAINPIRLPHYLTAVGDDGCDLVIVDSAAVSRDIALEATQPADFVLIPTRAAVLDVMAMTRSIELVRRFDRPAAVIITFCPPAGREVPDTRAAIRDLGATLCPVEIHDRKAYARAQQTGLTAQEYEPHGKAAAEIAKLYEYTCIQLHKDAAEGRFHGKKLTASGS